ncbi:phospholipid transporting ATPase [Coemansia sp. RSA 1200]|nr:phospholipid transporting ATPase [Coemansia sp. RSA 1200]
MTTAPGRRPHKRSWLSRIFSLRRRAGSKDTDELGEERTIYVNLSLPASEFDSRGRPPQYPANQIRTAKYTVLSFVPKNLFEQFRRAANVYFLFLLILQFIPAVATGMPGLSALALFTIIALTMAKDGYEDSKRSASDREANRAPATVLGNGWVNTNKPPAHFFRPRGPMRLVWGDSGSEGTVGGAVHSGSADTAHSSNFDNRTMGLDIDANDGGNWLKTEWRHLHVGDILLIRDGDPVPADVLLLNSSDEDGGCFVETKNLDGETNLKTKHALHKTTDLRSPAQFAAFRCSIDAEPPNTQLYSFKGSLRILSDITVPQMGTFDKNGQAAADPLSVENLLLRGSVVRNTKWAVGVIVFTGDETKIMMNSGETPSKRSQIERMMNYQVVTQFCLLFILCLLTAILGGVYYGESDSFSAVFIKKFETSKAKTSAPLYGFLTFWTSLILYQTVVPISLYVTIEFVRSFQAYFINQDIDMYYAPVDRRCTPKAWNLSDDLGQVEYIFSDKTGTLTQNVMVFRQCTIRGHVYGEIVADEEAEKASELRSAMDQKIGQFFSSPYRQSETSTFLDTSIYDDLQAENTQSRAVIEFFTILALCHTVIADVPDSTRPHYIEYKAESPDEAALVSTARDVGFTFLRREKDRVFCNFLGHEQSFQLLATLEFTSSRKRMSVIVRREDGRVMLLCKGADSIIMERIRQNQERLRQLTLDDLELFANHGLRTLCLGYRLLDEEEFTSWKRDYDVAMSSLGDREAMVEEVCERIECNLQLTGGTAIEDKLQDGVPETIAQLSLAGIKLWVLTGDKTETAINIGYSCNLLNNDMQLIVVKANDKDATRMQLERALREFGDTHGDLSYIGGGGGPMSGIARKSPGSWRRLLLLGGRSSKTNGKNPAFEHAREIAQNKNHRRGIKGIWDDVRTRNIPVERRGLAVKHNAPLGLVIDGESLKYALEPELAPLLLELAVRCQSVLCCRVSPLQKALVVRLVKEGLGTLCLSIGDGANDVSMIQEADIGIGISGEEGLQAVMASDYAIAQFRFLQKLLLVHGRWSYLRTTSMILNFFYKNIVFTVSLFWFQIFCQWSVSNMFDYTIISLYNMLFTSLPPGVLGVFDQDLPAVVGAVVPQLYKRGIYKLEYSMARFWMYIADGLYQAAAIVFLVIYTYYFSAAARSNGLDSASKDDVGTVGAFCVILVTNLYMGLNTKSWTWLMPVAQIIGIGLLLGVFFIYGVIYNTEFSAGAGSRVFIQVNFWFLLVLTTVLCLFPHYFVKFVRSAWHPTDTDVVREIVHGFRKGKSKMFQSWARPTYTGGSNYAAVATANAHKEVPFGAIPVQKPSMPQLWGRHPALHGGVGGGNIGHNMEGAIPLNDIGPYMSGSSSTRERTSKQHGGAGSNADALNGPEMYQGIYHPRKDAALVEYLHSLSHMNTNARPAQGGGTNILKRLSVHQQQQQQHRHAAPGMQGPSGETSRVMSEDVALQEDGNAVYQMAPLSRYDSYASARSSVYFLDNGTVEPYTGYAFAHQGQEGRSDRRSQRRIERRQH